MFEENRILYMYVWERDENSVKLKQIFANIFQVITSVHLYETLFSRLHMNYVLSGGNIYFHHWASRYIHLEYLVGGVIN